MPLGDVYPDSVVFICEDRRGSQTPIGTGFIVSVPYGELNFRYIVTARHVVEHERPTTARLRRRDDAAPDEVAIPEWFEHRTADVALAPFDIDTSSHRVEFIGSHAFADKWSERSNVLVQPGDPVFLIGLLSDLRSMAARAIPMVRSGRVGALYQSDIPVHQGKMRRREPSAHLIDAHSRAGFSGAPCVVEHLSISVPDATVFPYLILLGVVVGHFDSYVDVLPKQEDEGDHETDFRVRDNQGVAIVVPIEAVRDVLALEVLVEDRKHKQARVKAGLEKEDAESAATLDSVAGVSEFDRFENLTRKLVNVSKKELDEKRKDES